MVSVTRTFTVDQPVDAVIGYLKDFGHAEEWDPGTQRCTRDGSGPIEVGATWHNISKFLGRQTELTYRLERLEPGRVTFVGTNKTATSTDDITAVTTEAGTRIRYRADIRFHGAAKLAGPVLRLAFERLATATEKRLVEVVGRL